MGNQVEPAGFFGGLMPPIEWKNGLLKEEIPRSRDSLVGARPEDSASVESGGIRHERRHATIKDDCNRDV